MKRSLIAPLLGVTLVGCAVRVPPRAPLFPLSPVWEQSLDDFVVPPLAADASRLFVATRAGTLFALSQETGAVLWKREGQPGRLAAAPGRLIVHAEDGTVTSLRVRNGEVRWTTKTAVVGEAPPAPTVDGERVYVSGRGLVALEADTGRILWTQSSPTNITAPPVATSARLLVGEADGTLRCLDRATGLPLWAHQTGDALRAPVLVDEERRRIYVGTADRRILEVNLDNGDRGWRWKVGADIEAPGLLLPDRVFFASFDAVLYGLHRGGNLAWRSALPSRPLSGPLLLDDSIVIACHENEILGFDLAEGRSLGSLRTAAEIRTAPLISGRQIFVGLRNRSVVAYTVPSLGEQLMRGLGGGQSEDEGPEGDDAPAEPADP